MTSAYIIAYARTPIGSFLGKLSSYSATSLGAHVIKACVQKSAIDPMLIEEVIMGNVLSAGLGQNPARQSALKAGLSPETNCTGVNKVCASGLKAVMLAAAQIQSGHSHVVAAGGMESMSNVPYYLQKHRTANKFGHDTLVDGLLKDGLWDVYHDFHMGNAAENTARQMKITRAMQDEYAAMSYQRSNAAIASKIFHNELAALADEQATMIDDEQPGKANYEKMPMLKPVFDQSGTITAANASPLSDGAAALILVSEEVLKKHHLKPLARIVSFADAEQEPIWFTTSPSKAIVLALKKAGINKNNIGLFEINEAFAVVSIANNILLDINPEIVNVYGGAISMGHPLGASGARILCTLLNAATQKNIVHGVAAICNGGGGASAMVVEML